MSQLTSSTLPLLPLPDGVVVPHMVVNLVADSDDARRTVAAARAGDGRLLMVPRVDGAFAGVGTIATIEQAEPLPGGRVALVLRGLSRGRIGATEMDADATLRAVITPVESTITDEQRVDALAVEYRRVLGEILELRGARGVLQAVDAITDPGTLADFACYSPDLTPAQKVELLETLDVAERLGSALGWARETLASLSVQDEIASATGQKVNRSQREFLLRQQLAAIREELGETGADDDLISEYRQKLEALGLPQAAHEAVTKEIDRFERMSEQSPEHGWVRTWLDTVFDVPWSERSEDHTDLDAARTVLDADHTGLDEIKDRLIEFLAVRKLRAERNVTTTGRRGGGAVLALVGPPGVGKTSLGESVARALGRRFVRVALGGIRDEAEIRGHRRTYVGAQPGRIVRALREAGTMNPVFLLDEVDKVAADWRGDPTAALLEVLDPAQNHTFRDHYLELELDLSDVLFIATANMLETIPAALLDRMEIVRLDGYTEAEKLAIARDHLLPRQLGETGLAPEDLEVTDAALAALIDGWTQGAGVRGVEKRLGTLARKAALRIANGATERPIHIDEEDLRELLGRRSVHHEPANEPKPAGVATGLAVTGAGGDTLAIEATVMPGSEGLTLTGQLGDVMKESAAIALSYVRGHSSELGVDGDTLGERRVHLHVPAGAIPKDGPSAGITMVTALASLLTGRPVRPEIGMTGEVTLQGRVLPIGGLKQKVLAAHRAGLRTVILPERNAEDLEDVPEPVRAEMTFHPVGDVADVLRLALEDAEEGPARQAA
ncbi:MAG: endopeptidase La [Egibacteraceae bacterium]